MAAFLIALLVLVALALLISFSAAHTIVEKEVRRRKTKQANLFEPREYDYFQEEIDSEYYKQAYKWVKEQEKQVLSIESEDGLKLNAHYYKKDGAKNTAIIAPGWTDVKEKFFTPVKMFYDLNFNVLIIDQRAQGTSEGEYNTFGVMESSDVLKWVSYLKENKLADKIVLWGISMGAATIMLAASKLDENSPVVCAVEDCGYTDMEDQFLFVMGSRAPWLPAFLGVFIIKIVRLLLKRRAGFSSLDAAPVNKLPECKIPMLFIHGDEDDFVPFYMLEDLFNAHKGPKQKLVIKGAKHAQALYKGTEQYISALQDFLKISNIKENDKNG
ncbi:MAG: alpha/beta hydrolase [Christensenellales bacterium]|jgi:fermentation-respiration switch protein FrsA (DUF1100 family)